MMEEVQKDVLKHEVRMLSFFKAVRDLFENDDTEQEKK